MMKPFQISFTLLCIISAGVLYAQTGSLQVSLRDVITGYGVSGTVTFSGPQQSSVLTDGEGNLSVTLPRGDYILQVSADGYRSLTSHTQVSSDGNLPVTIMLDSTSISEDERPQQLSQQLHPRFTLLHGYLVDSKTAKPIAGVRVQLLEAHVETETNAKGHYSLSVVTPKEPQPGIMGTDTLVFEKSGYDKVIVQNFGIGGKDLRLAPLGLRQGNSVIRRDGSHKLSGQSPYEPQSASPAFKLTAGVYKQLVTPGKRFSVGDRRGTSDLLLMSVPGIIRVGMGQAGRAAFSTCRVPHSFASFE
jgi:hypothetical protein